MKTNKLFQRQSSLGIALVVLAALLTHFAAPPTFAATYYWDGNTNASGFGSPNAASIWSSAGTAATATNGWGTVSSGVQAGMTTITTTTSDPLHFGTDTVALGGGTITVSGTVNASTLRFGSATVGNVILSGGVINLAAATSIHVGAGGTTVHTISSQITGAGTSLTKTGNILSLSGSNTFSGSTIISAGTLRLANTNALKNTSGISMVASTTLSSTVAGGTTIAAPITLSGVGNINLLNGNAAASTVNLNGAIGGATSNLVFSTDTTSHGNASSVLVLGAAGTYTGNTVITTGNGGNNPVTVRNGVANALPVTTVLSFDGVVGGGTGRNFQYELNGNNQTLAGLSNTVASLRRQLVTSATAATLTISNTADMSFGGSDLTTGSTTRAQITGAIALTKNGAGTFTLGGTLLGGATPGGNTHTGDTKILGGILVLGETLSLQNSPFDTANSITGDAANGLRSTVTTLTLGGLTGNKNLTNVFTTTSGGYTGVTGLTLNPGAGVINTYSADVGNGNGSMTLTKSGAGTQILTGPHSYSGATLVSLGKLVVSSTHSVTGAVTVIANAELGVTASGTSQWLPASLTLADPCTLEFNSVTNSGTTTAPILPTAAVGTVSNVTINVNSLSGAVAVNNSYPLLGNQDGTTNGYSLGVQPPGNTGHLAVSGTTLVYVVDTISDIWTGTDGTNPTWWDINTSINWTAKALGNSPAGSYLDGDNVLFDDTASPGSPVAVAIQTNVAPASLRFDNSTKDYIVTGSGANVIGGSGGLTKSGSGTVTLSGSHTYGGNTIISAGTLKLGAADVIPDASPVTVTGILDLNSYNETIGVLTGAGVVSNGVAGTATLTVGKDDPTPTTFAGVIKAGTGALALTKIGTNTLTLSAGNTFIGATTVSNGTLQLLRPGTITSSAGVTVPTNGTLLFNNNGANYTSIIPPISLNGGTLTNYSSVTHYTVAQNSAVTADAPSTIGLFQTTAGDGGFYLDGGLKGSAALTINADVSGAAVGLSLRTTNSTYSGSLTVNGVASAAVGAGSGLVVGANGAGNVCNLTNATITVNGTMAMGLVASDMSWANNAAVNGATFRMDALNGTGVVVANFTTASSTRTLSLGNNNGSGNFSGVIAAGTNSTLSLIKNGTGTQTLSGANAYTGTTAVSAGTLQLGADNTLPTTTALTIGSGNNNGTLNLANFNQQVGMLTIASTNDIATTNSVLIGAGKTLTVTNGLAVGINTGANSITRLNVIGAGTLDVTGGNYQVGGNTTTTFGNAATNDMSGLNNFSYNNTNGTLRVGDATNAGGQGNGASTLILAATNNITAAVLTLNSPIAQLQTLKLGSGTNAVNADTINIGSVGNRSSGVLQFNTGTGSLSIRNTAGTGRANMTVAYGNATTGVSFTGDADLTGHYSDLLLGNLQIGGRSGASGGGATGTFSFDAGILDATTVAVGLRAGSTATTATTATLNLGGGTVTLGSLTLAQNSATTTIAAFATNSISGGTVTITNAANSITLGNNTGAGNNGATAVLNLTGGLLTVAGNIAKGSAVSTVTSLLNIDGGTLNLSGKNITGVDTITYTSGLITNLGVVNTGIALAGSGSREFGQNTGVSGEIQGVVSGSGVGLNKTGDGALTLTGAPGYDGATTISAGKLVVPSTHSGTGTLTVSANATLGVTVSGVSQWQPASLSLGNPCILEFSSVQNPGGVIAPLLPTAAVGLVTNVTININSIAGTVLVNNSYPLLGGVIATNGYSLATQPANISGRLDINGTTLVYIVETAPDVWAGADGTNPTWWDVTNTVNWTGGAVNNTPTGTYTNGDFVVFEDAFSPASPVTVALQTPVTPGGVTFDNSTKEYIVTASGANVIGGSGTLTKSGTNTVNLSGSHTYSGDTTISAGTLKLGGNDVIPEGSSKGNVAVTGTLDLNTFSDTINGLSGAGTVDNTAAGTPTLTVGGNNTSSTFSGVIANTAGTLALTKAGSGTQTLTGNNTYSGGTTNTGNGVLISSLGTNYNSLGTGSVFIDSGATNQVNNVNTVNVTGLPALTNTFTGSGLLRINFAANTTARSTTIPNVTGFGGIIQLANLGATGDKWNAASLGTVLGSLVVDSGSTIFVQTAPASFTGGITLNGAGSTEGRGAIRMGGTTLGGNISLASSTTISMESTASALLTGNISSGAAGTQSLTLGGTGSTGGTLSGNIGGGVGTINGLTNAAGAYTLANSNSYTGPTVITAGAGKGIIVTTNNALGATGSGNETTIAGTVGSSGAWLRFSGGVNYTTTEKIIGYGYGDGRGFIQGANGSNTFAGDIELSANGESRIGTQDGAQLTLTGAMTQGSGITTANILFRVGGLAGDFVTLANAGNSFGGDSTVYTTLAGPGYAGLRLGVDNAHPTNLTILNYSSASGAATALDLNGKNQTLNGLANGGSGTLNIINLDTVNASTLTLNPTTNKSATFRTPILGGGGLGVINLVKDGAFTQTFSGTNTYTGTTAISAGTLKLANDSAINLTSGLSIAAGATLDTIALTVPPPVTIPITASGTGTNVGTTAAAILGVTGQPQDLGSRPITLGFDGANPALYLKDGTLNLTDNPFTINGAVLANGAYTIIAQSDTNDITGSVALSTVNGTALTGKIGTVSLSTNTVVLTVSSIGGPSGSNAYLTNLTITPAGTLSPTFQTNLNAYTATNAYLDNPVTVTAGLADANATLQLSFNGGAGTLLTNNVASGSQTLILPTNTLAVRVVSQDLTVTNTYTVNVLLQPSLVAPRLTNSVSGSTLTLSWPASHLGYTLQQQTNSRSVGLKTNWVAVPGTASLTTTNLTIDKLIPTTFYRLVYP